MFGLTKLVGLSPSRDFMDPTMDNTKHILNYLMPIIDQVNPELHDFMQRYICVCIYVCPHTCAHTPLFSFLLAFVYSSQI